MPAIYAHDRFGAIVSEQLKGDLKELVSRYYTQFKIGLQGPDIFFFYKAYSSNRVTKYGYRLHGISAWPFFNHAVSVVREKGRDSREYAYLLGFLCHFILDSECHPYVREMIEKSGVQHLEIEEEFEKKLLRADGKDALAYPLWELIPTDRQTAEAIAPFYRTGKIYRKSGGYRKIHPQVVRTSLKWMRRVKRLFWAPGIMKQELINSALKLSGRYGKLKGLMLQRVDNPRCQESNQGLQQRFDDAVEVAVNMIGSFDDTVCQGTRLNRRFNRTFE